MKEYLLELGFQKYDLALLIFCPLGAVIGSFAHAILQIMNPHRVPKPGTVRILAGVDAVGRFGWLAFRLALGAILGLVVGLYFIGALQENLTTLAKIVALCILLGYAAPKIWLAQEQVVVDEAIKHLKVLAAEATAKNQRVPSSRDDRSGEKTP
jgi:hypothetical protein